MDGRRLFSANSAIRRRCVKNAASPAAMNACTRSFLKKATALSISSGIARFCRYESKANLLSGILRAFADVGIGGASRIAEQANARCIRHDCSHQLELLWRCVVG
jgi:hypothetical protein